MAFLRVEKKQSGTYLRIIESYKESGKSKHRTLHSLGKVEDYPPNQLEAIAKKLLELSGTILEDIIPESFHEVARYNYGYGLVLKKLWAVYHIDTFIRQINNKRRLRFDWQDAFKLMIAERLNDPCSKRQSAFTQNDYKGICDRQIPLHHLYRCLDVLAEEQEFLKTHLFQVQQTLFSQELDVVFYDVTTLYFESQKQQEGSLRQKGYSKDGKAHKTQVVLGLLIDKMRNPISYQIYQGNTYEGKTMLDALETLKKQYQIDQAVVVADSAMIDQSNQEFILQTPGLDYIIGDRIKNLPKKIIVELLDTTNHIALDTGGQLTYTETNYKGRRIICTYSQKRANKDAFEREKLIAKAQKWIDNPSQYKQAKTKGAAKYIRTNSEDTPEINLEKMNNDAKYDGFKAIATSSTLEIEELLEKYRELWQVERTFRTLKSQLAIRPMFHWTNKRIEGHIAMCFVAFTFLNYIRNTVKTLSEKQIIKALDRMQLSAIQSGDDSKELVYMRSKITDNQTVISKSLKIVVPKDITSQKAINQCFT